MLVVALHSLLILQMKTKISICCWMPCNLPQSHVIYELCVFAIYIDLLPLESFRSDFFNELFTNNLVRIQHAAQNWIKLLQWVICIAHDVSVYKLWNKGIKPFLPHSSSYSIVQIKLRKVSSSYGCYEILRMKFSIGTGNLLGLE